MTFLVNLPKNAFSKGNHNLMIVQKCFKIYDSILNINKASITVLRRAVLINIHNSYKNICNDAKNKDKRATSANRDIPGSWDEKYGI